MITVLVLASICILCLIFSYKDKENYVYETNEIPNTYMELGVDNYKSLDDDDEDDMEDEEAKNRRDKVKYRFIRAQQQEQRNPSLERTVKNWA